MRLRHLVLALAGAAVLLAGSQAFAQKAAPPAGWSATDCQSCHDKAAGPASCASCHTNVAEHMKGQMGGDKNAPTPSVKKLTVKQVNETCLKCHEKAGQANYTASMHARRNVACTSCHSVHDAKSARGQLKTKVDSETCFTCHQTERAKAQRTSHHPVREGKMSCTSCHNPHDGSRPKMIQADSVNDLCYKCHAEKRGPFLFEHAPVREDCVSCHEPHGTNHKRLLSQKLPNLCWNCHFTGSGHFAQNTNADNHGTEQGKYQVAPTGTTNFPTTNSRMIEKSCKNCHVNLHGSNSPSGAAFLR
jgi:DmsE family decaheme c-type cytochrome